MTTAYLSARAKLALRQEGRDWRVLSYEALESGWEPAGADVVWSLMNYDDVSTLSDVTDEELQDRLIDAVDESEAMDLTLLLVDHRLSNPTRLLAAEELEEIVCDPIIRMRLERLFSAQPFSAEAAVDDARQLVPEQCPHVAAYLDWLAAHQAAIGEVFAAWNSSWNTEEDSAEERRTYAATFLDLGVFRDVATEYASSGTVTTPLLAWSTDRELKRRLPGVVSRLKSWLKPIQKLGGRRLVGTTESTELHFDELPAALDRFEVDSRPYRGVRLRAHEAKAKADRMMEHIRGLMRQHHLAEAAKVIEQLVALQCGNDGSGEYAAQSLCNLATFAEELNLFSLEEQLTERAVELSPNDPVACSQRAHVFVRRGRPLAALELYNEIALHHPDHVVAKNGRAEVLKTLGRLDDALAAYEDIAREHPENVVAKSGRAEILKALGRLDDALAAYEDIGREHPENVVAKNGRAEVLKALGRLDDALAAYEDIAREHPEDVFAKTGRAEVLKALGRLDDALAAYEDIGREHPENVVAKSGRAEVLKALGRLDDALAAYEAIGREHPADVFTKTGRAEVLKTLGRLDDALAAYEDIGREHPEDVFAKTGRAEVLKALGRLDDALAAYEDIAREHPENVVARTGMSSILVLTGQFQLALDNLTQSNLGTFDSWIQEHIRGMVFLRMGRLDNAAEIFARGVSDCPFASSRSYFQNAAALCEMRRGRFDSAAAMFDRNAASAEDWAGRLLRVHALAETQQPELAATEFAKLPDLSHSAASTVVQEIRCRYIQRSGPQHADLWLFDEEAKICLLHQAA